MLIGFVTNTDHHETISGCLPHSVKGALNVVKSIWDTNLLFNFIGFISDWFSLFVFS